jgi:hypothetical protein
MAWDEGQTLTARWEYVCQAAKDLHPHWRLGRSYSGFTSMLLRHSPALIEALKRRFQREMLASAGNFWRRGRWQAFAVDGSRIEAPHTLANETDLGCAGREKTAPQVFLTVLWQMGLGLPWDFRAGPGTDSERTHMKDMISSLPSHSLLVADAGFVGYELCSRLLEHGHNFLLRVGGNVHLLTELGYFHEERDGLVYLWPQEHRQSPPLVLRLIVLRQGKQDVYLLTNVVDPKQLTDEEAGTLYGMRWGEEVFYRSYKQTMDRQTVLSRTAPTCLAEVQWTLMGLWLLGLLTVSRLTLAGVDPLEMSVAKARDAVRAALRNTRPRRGARRFEVLLRSAIKDDYQSKRSKAARNYPRKKRETPPEPPKTRAATGAEIKRAQRLPPPQVPRMWTA